MFNALFLVEAIINIIGKGFLFHKNSYLRDPWNVLDFFVVILSLLDYIPAINSTSLKFLRTFRVLRPLRTIKRMPKMRRLIQTLFASLSGLLGVLFFIVFIVYLFAIFGINSFSGTQYRFCRTTPEPTITRGSEG